MSDPMLVAVELAYRAGDATLLEGVELMAVPGEVVVVIGPNGAGKSTLLRLLSGDLTPTRGHVELAGRRVDGAALGELALVRAVLPEREPDAIGFLARSIVAMGRHPHRRRVGNTRDEDAAAVEDAMRRTATSDLAPRVFSTLSKGERARISLARVIAQHAPVVLLDEPTAALDMAGQEGVLSDAKMLAGEGTLVVAVLHDLNAAAYYADRLVLLADGKTVAVGSPRDVLTADVLTRVYGQRIRVVDHPFRPCPLVLVDS
jgi:heme transport system ATP-binding protein